MATLINEISQKMSELKTTQPSASNAYSLERYERIPKGQHTRLIDENRLKGFISEGQWA